MAVAAYDHSMFADIRDPSLRVRELCNYACKVDIDMAIPPKRYLRSGHEMLRMAKVYQDEGNFESAFILYTKFISLFVEKLPKHPDYKSATGTDIAGIKKKVKLVFPIAEEIKSKLKKKYAEIERKRQEEEARKQEELAQEQEKLRQEEEERRRKQEEQEEQDRLQMETRWLNEQERRLQELKDQEMRKKLNQDKNLNDDSANAFLLTDANISGLNNYQRPSAPPGELAFIPNNLGDKTFIEKNLVNRPQGPSIPDRELKKNLVISDSSSPGNEAPAVDRGTKPSSFDHFTSTGISGSNKGGLRDVILPSDLMRKFLVIAEHNTLRNVETCGILAGKLLQNSFHLTHVLIPKQSGTSDTCVAEDEEDMFNYQEPRDLITLGWIHTHPSQTAFLSSVDMHNQYGYQAMLPEAIAVVCAPKYNETGIFYLTPERGMPEMGSCRERGFHEHRKTPPLFDTCGHVRVVDNEYVEVADLRKM